jgi:hypothetical protein
VKFEVAAIIDKGRALEPGCFAAVEP